jgi:hypothetical protein
MKKILLINIFLVMVISLVQGQDFTGIWKGKIMTTDKFLPYELAISDSNGVLSGYSYTTYTVNSMEMVAVRRIKVRVEGNMLLTDDDGLLYDNFQDKIAKKIRQHNKLTFEMNGQTPVLKGSFETEKTKDLRSASGDIVLSKTPEIDKTDVGKKLAEMNLYRDLSFVPLEPALHAKLVITAKKMAYPQKEKPMYAVQAKKRPVVNYKDLATRKPEPQPVASNVTPIRKPVMDQSSDETVPSAPLAAATRPKAPVVSSVDNAPSAVSVLAGRTVENIETIYFSSDSLQFTLYDNGEVDGDTVSVIVNGKMIMEKQGLSTRPISKKIYVPKGTDDELQIVMFAETLGTIPPNTGLLIVQDGNVRHEVRFSGDLKKNAAITLRRRQQE